MDSKHNEIIELMKIQWKKMGIDATTEMMEMIKTNWETAGMDPQAMLNQFKLAEQTSQEISQQVAEVDLDEEENEDDDDDYEEEEEDEESEDDNTDGNYEFIAAKDADVSDENAQKGIACGSNLAFINKHNLNALSTFKPPFLISRIMKRDWGINSREELLEMLIWLQMEGHKQYYTLVLEKLKDIAPTEWANTVENVFYEEATWLHPNDENREDELEKVNGYIENVMVGYIRLAEWGCFKTMPLPKIETWDLGRAINLVRWGYDIKYLDKDEALYLINQYYTELKNCYDSWESLSEGYLMGFMMWSGNDVSLHDLFQNHITLLTLKESPWVNLEW